MTHADLQQTPNGSLPEDFTVLYTRYGPAAFRLAVRQVRDRDLAADVVQEAFLSLWRSRHNYRPERGPVGGLLHTLVHRRAVELLRRRASWPVTQLLDHQVAASLPTSEPGPSELACDRDQASHLLDAIGKLTPERQQAVRLVWLHDYRASEIAALLGIPTGTVKTRLLTARPQLRALIPPESFH